MLLSLPLLTLGCKTNEEAILDYSREFESKLGEEEGVRTDIYFILEDLKTASGSVKNNLLDQLEAKSSELKHHVEDQMSFMRRMAVPGGCVRFHRDYLAYSIQTLSAIDEINGLAESSKASNVIAPRLFEITPTLFGYPDFPPRSGPADACPNLSGYN